MALVALVALVTLKGLLQALVAARVARFSYGLQADLARLLYATYLGQPYEYHLTRNSEKLINTINNEARDAATAMHSAISLIAEALVVIGLGGVLVALSPAAGIGVALVAVVVGASITQRNRTQLVGWGQQMREQQALRMRSLRQGFDGYKEIRLRGLEPVAVAAFDAHNVAHTDAGSHFAALSALPRLWMEWLSVVSLAAVMLVLGTEAQGLKGLIPYLGMVAAAAFRLLPSLSRIVGGFQNIRFYAPTISHVVAELGHAAAPSMPALAAPIVFTRDIAFSAVSYAYPGTARPALERFDATIARGALVGVVGPSGAGKTTFIDLLLGFIKPGQGCIMVDGIAIDTAAAEWRRRIGYVAQSNFLIDDSLRRNIAFGVADADIDDDRVLDALAAAQLRPGLCADKAGLDLLLGDRGARLSGGQRQRVTIARALYQNPEILVVDEGTSALDAQTEAGIMAMLRALRGTRTIIVASHSEAALADFDQIIRIEPRPH